MAAVLKAAQTATKYLPLFDRIMVLRADPVKKSKGGLVLPSTVKKANRAVVVSVGPGPTNSKGKYLPLQVKVGDCVLLPDFHGAKVEIEGIDYEVYKESNILAKLEF